MDGFMPMMFAPRYHHTQHMPAIYSSSLKRRAHIRTAISHPRRRSSKEACGISHVIHLLVYVRMFVCERYKFHVGVEVVEWGTPKRSRLQYVNTWMTIVDR